MLSVGPRQKVATTRHCMFLFACCKHLCSTGPRLRLIGANTCFIFCIFTRSREQSALVKKQQTLHQIAYLQCVPFCKQLSSKCRAMVSNWPLPKGGEQSTPCLLHAAFYKRSEKEWKTVGKSCRKGGWKHWKNIGESMEKHRKSIGQLTEQYWKA